MPRGGDDGVDVRQHQVFEGGRRRHGRVRAGDLQQRRVQPAEHLGQQRAEQRVADPARRRSFVHDEAAADDVRTSIQSVQDAFAQEQQRLQTLVDAGMLSRTDADKFLAKNPKFAQLMQGADSEAISGNMRGNVAKDLRSAEGAGQLYSLINGTVSNEAKQIALLTEMRDEARKARIDASKRGKAVKI